MSDEADNVIRFPIERRLESVNGEDVVYYTSLISVATDNGENACPTWGHIWVFGEKVCLCGKERSA